MFGRGPKSPGKAGLSDRIQKIARSAPSEAASPTKVRVVSSRGSRSERRPTFVDGVIELRPGVRQQVAIRNASQRGVRVEFANGLSLPDRVFLIAPGLGLRCWARVVWKDGRAAGLQLEPPT